MIVLLNYGLLQFFYLRFEKKEINDIMFGVLGSILGNNFYMGTQSGSKLGI